MSIHADGFHPGKMGASGGYYGQHEGEPGTSLMTMDPHQVALPPVNWYPGPPAPPEILNPGLDPIWLLHSLRRRWVLAAGLGLMAGALLALAVWIGVPAKASATAILKVASVKPSLVFQIDEGGESDYETYKRTLLGLIKAQPVLQAALREPGIKDLPTLRDEPDELKVNWLRTNLDVAFDQNAELMRISMEGERPGDLVKIVNATTSAFLEEIIFAERESKLRNKDTLTRSFHKTQAEIEQKQQAYVDLAKELYTQESPEGDVQLSLAANEQQAVRQQIAELRGGILEAETRLAQLEANQGDPQLLESRVEEELAKDAQLGALREQLSLLELQFLQEQGIAKRADAPSLIRLRSQQRLVKQQIAQRESQLRPRLKFQLRNSPDYESQAEIRGEKIRLENMRKALAEAKARDAELLEERKRLGAQSLELARLEEELEQLKTVARSMGNKIESWNIELASPERVTKVQDAEITPGLNKFQRYVLVGLGGLVGFGITCFGVAFWEFQLRRLNDAQQIEDGLGLRVVGKLPMLIGRKASGADDPLVAQLVEAIDNVRTTLMHMGSGKQTRVVMITSAGCGEGRSTVALRLADSFSRAGKRTILVDADLRQPRLHDLFGAPLENGICEILRGEVEASATIQATQAENLWLLTAGYWDHGSALALAQDCMAPLLRELREEFDYVIVDAPPVLDLADSLIIGQHVDGAIVSVMRDISQVPKIHEASDRLKSVGVRTLGAVVNGAKHPLDDRAANNRLVALSRLEASHDGSMRRGSSLPSAAEKIAPFHQEGANGAANGHAPVAHANGKAANRTNGQAAGSHGNGNKTNGPANGA